MKKLLCSFFLLLTVVVGRAEDFEVDGIYYNITSAEEHTVAVTFRGDRFYLYYEYFGDVIIPETVTYEGMSYRVTSIGYAAFGECYTMTSVTIPNSVTTIGEQAFGGCTGLTSISIPNSVTTIDKSAFGACTGLTSITIPNSVTTIGERVFYACRGLTSIAIPNSVTSIGKEAFSGCNGLTSVVIPNSVTEIGNYAFYGCSGLTSITIPNSVTEIGKGAFAGCGLICATIGNSVITIGENAFYNCNALKEVCCFAESVPTANKAFDSRYLSYASLHVSDTSLQAYSTTKPWSDFGQIIDDCDDIELLVFTVDNICYSTISPETHTVTVASHKECSDSVVIPESVSYNGVVYNVTRIASAFVDCSSITCVTIPNSVTEIGEHAFYGCSGLTSVTIPNSVTEIGKHAFYNCSALTSVTIPNSVTEIGNYAFSNCSGLTSITIGNSVVSIGLSAFHGCNDLKDIYCLAESVPIANGGWLTFSPLAYSSATLHVPAVSLETYKTTSPWKRFEQIVVIDEGDGIEQLPSSEVNSAFKNPTVYDLNGRCTTKMQKGINLLRNADGRVKKIWKK